MVDLTDTTLVIESGGLLTIVVASFYCGRKLQAINDRLRDMPNVIKLLDEHCRKIARIEGHLNIKD